MRNPLHRVGTEPVCSVERAFRDISFLLMASSTSAYSFTDEEVSHLANCNDQAEFLHFFQRILQSKSINLTAVFDAQTTLVSSTDYGASVLTRFFETQSHALHLEVGYALFKSCNSSTCLSWDSTSLPKSITLWDCAVAGSCSYGSPKVVWLI